MKGWMIMAKRSNTRGANGNGTIRKRSDGRWEGRYTCGFDPVSGQQIQRSVYGKSQKDVRTKLTQIANDIDQGVYTEPTKMTIGSWLDIWLKEYKTDVKPNTIDQYDYQIRTHLKPAFGRVNLQELTAPMVQQLYNSRLKPYKIKQKMCNGKPKVIEKTGLSPKSIRNIHSVLHEALDKALKLGYVKTNVCDAVTLPKVQKSEMHPVKDEGVGAFLNAIKGNPLEPLLYVTAFTGLRQGEVIGLTWDCIDFKKNTIRVYRQLQKERKPQGEYHFVSLKNDKQRIFMVAENVINVLRRVKTKQAEWRLAAGEAWEGDEEYVFTDELGRHIPKSTVYKNFKRCAVEAGIPMTRFHDLRHTYATLALQQGTDIKTVSSNLGHATVAFTLDTYGHVTEQMQKDSADRMQKYLESL